LSRILLAIILLQVLHVYWVETGRVFSIVYILAEGWESISFIGMSSMMLGADKITCVIVEAIMIS
jgi:hypothetical protein